MSSTDEGQLSRVIVLGGTAAEVGDAEAFDRRLRSIIGAFIQIKSLNVLIGAGASYPLGSPKIRSMTFEDLEQMVKRAERGLAEDERKVLSALVEAQAGEIDLEYLLTTLNATISVCGFSPKATVHLGKTEVGRDTLMALRRTLNQSLAVACDLPAIHAIEDDSLKVDPLGDHRTFFRRLLRSRRLDLPRVRVFTTNYDLVVEKALDADGIAYIDGFTGTVERTFRPESFDQDLYLPPDPNRRRLLRVPDLLYLYKLHGSINWRARAGTEPGFAEQVIQIRLGSNQSGEDQLALVYPTPLKEGEVLGHPYSTFFTSFLTSLVQPDAALLVIGYGFADAHINRLLVQALGSPSFQMFVVTPGGVIDTGSDEETELGTPFRFAESPLGAVARIKDARISVLTGPTAGTFSYLAQHGMPDSGEPDQGAEDVQTQLRTSLA